MAPHERVHLDAFVVAMSVLRVARAEVDRIDAGDRELRDRGPRLLRSQLKVARLAQPSHQRVRDAHGPRRCVAVDAHLDLRHREQLAQASLGLGRGVAGRVAKVDARLDPVGDDVGCHPTVDRGHAHHFSEREALDRDLARGQVAQRGEGGERTMDRVLAQPRPRAVGRAARDRDGGVQVAQAADLDRVVGRLHDDRQVDRASLRAPIEQGSEGALDVGQLLTPEEQEPDVGRARLVPRARPRARSMTASAPFMSDAPRPTTAPSSIAPGTFAGDGHGVDVAGEHHERQPRVGARASRTAPSPDRRPPVDRPAPCLRSRTGRTPRRGSPTGCRRVTRVRAASRSRSDPAPSITVTWPSTPRDRPRPRTPGRRRR